MKRSLALVPSLLATGLALPCAAQTVPDGFEVVRLSGAFFKPVGIVFLESGELLVHGRDGRVWRHDGQAMQPLPVIDLRDEVNDYGDRGLLGLAIHPGFTPDGGPRSWIYLLYTVSPVPGQDVAFDHDDRYSFSRLTRYRTTTTGGALLAIPGSRHVLLGRQEPDGSVPLGIASLHESHSNGSLVFGEDGTLLVAVGDGAHFETTDVGGMDDPGFDDWVHPTTGLRGPIPKAQDLGAFRSQSLDSLAGKILRIDPSTGLGLPSNPFYDGDPQSIRSRVWALGLRNPFRATLLAGTGSADPGLGDPGTLVIADVGNVDWEEIDLCQGGENFGWPCREGLFAATWWTPYDPPGPEPPPCGEPLLGVLTDPTVSFHHAVPESYSPAGLYQDEDGTPLAGFTGGCVTGAAQYLAGGYPDEYAGRIFFSDFAFGWIKTLELDAAGAVVAIRPFGEGFFKATTLALHPITGDLYVATVDQVEIARIRYTAPDAIQPYGCGVNPPASLALAAPLSIGAGAEFLIDNPLGTQTPGAATVLGLSVQPDLAYPCGLLLPGFGMAGPLALGEMLIDTGPGKLFDPVPGPAWTGAPTPFPVPVPHVLTLFGQTVYVQGAIVDPTFGGGTGPGVGLTEALELRIGS